MHLKQGGVFFFWVAMLLNVQMQIQYWSRLLTTPHMLYHLLLGSLFCKMLFLSISSLGKITCLIGKGQVANVIYLTTVGSLRGISWIQHNYIFCWGFFFCSFFFFWMSTIKQRCQAMMQVLKMKKRQWRPAFNASLRKEIYKMGIIWPLEWLKGSGGFLWITD